MDTQFRLPHPCIHVYTAWHLTAIATTDAYPHRQFLSLRHSSTLRLRSGTVWYAHLPTCRGANNISFHTNLYLPVPTPLQLRQASEANSSCKGLGASATAQLIDPGGRAVCNTALLSNTAHHGHSRSSGHDAQELMGWWAYCMHRSIPKRIERPWHASTAEMRRCLCACGFRGVGLLLPSITPCMSLASWPYD